MTTIIKLHEGKKTSIWEVIKQGPVQFDPRPNWILLGLPIGGIHKDLKWVHPSEIRAEWVREFKAFS